MEGYNTCWDGPRRRTVVKIMMHSDGKTGLLMPPGDLSEEDKLCVHKALDEMAGSVPFRTSRQCQDLLRYIVLHSLSGEEESLRERIIGVEVFGRRPDYDQAADPVVRIRAADVRKRIALYYEAADAAARLIKIGIPSGSYKAFFEFTGRSKKEHLTHRPAPALVAPASVESPVLNPPLVTTAPAESKRTVRVWIQAWIKEHRLPVLTILAMLLISVLYGMLQETRQTAFERFWSPVLKNPNHGLVYVGSNAVYSLSQAFLDKYRQEHYLDKVEMMGREFLVPLGPNDIIAGIDLVPIKDTYVTVGDVAATARIASFLSLRKKEYDMRFGGDISVGDLRERPAILIGGFNNSWTLEMTDNLRYVFAYQYQIQDRFDKRKSWKPDPAFTEDYAIVSRILNSKTGEILIAAAGIGQAGTRAAGEFLTSPNAITSVMLGAPKGWEKRNMQIVLHTTVINGSPNPPDVVATYYW
jgi:hypothetical protein